MMSRRFILRFLVGSVVTLVLLPVPVVVAIAALPPTVSAAAHTRAWLSDADYLDAAGVRFQRTGNDCGVAALEMMLPLAPARMAPLASWRTLAARRDSGLTLLELSRAARTLGVETVGVRATLEQLRHLPLPAIVHFDDHYVVVDVVAAERGVWLRDPAIGRLHMTPDAFRLAWTGEALVVRRHFAPSRAVGGAQ